MLPAPLEWRRLVPGLEGPLSAFFDDLTEGDRAFFHPHLFTHEAAVEICSGTRQDFFGAMIEGESVLAYGMLRGWDEGYAIPSLGIAVHPAARGLGLSRLTMGLLHITARRRGAKSIRLSTHPKNQVALSLYKSLGYEFAEDQGEQLVGFLKLT